MSTTQPEKTELETQQENTINLLKIRIADLYLNHIAQAEKIMALTKEHTAPKQR